MKISSSEKLWRRICDAADKFEKSLPEDYYFTVDYGKSFCVVTLIDDTYDCFEELDGGYFNYVRQFKSYFKCWRQK
jgi:hypothetical protein